MIIRQLLVLLTSLIVSPPTSTVLLEFWDTHAKTSFFAASMKFSAAQFAVCTGENDFCLQYCSWGERCVFTAQLRHVLCSSPCLVGLRKLLQNGTVWTLQAQRVILKHLELDQIKPSFYHKRAEAVLLVWRLFSCQIPSFHTELLKKSLVDVYIYIAECFFDHILYKNIVFWQGVI